MPLYHGGFGGLSVGDLVLPSGETGATCKVDFGAVHCRRDRVYVTPHEDVARLFAAFHTSGAGKVYEVTPIGDLEHDPDCETPGSSFAVSCACVVRVIPLAPGERSRIIWEHAYQRVRLGLQARLARLARLVSPVS